MAERALVPVLPSVEEFPYAIRVVSEVLSSNGSTSMGSTCGSCLALMDAGVPIKRPVAGIAMGLIERVKEDGSSEFAILSDIQGMEDFLLQSNRYGSRCYCNPDGYKGSWSFKRDFRESS